jgi:AcrR family transcriptional regulator
VEDVQHQTRRSNAGRSRAARQRVLASALNAFAANGYSGSSLAGIAAGAGLTTAGLLHHYASKEDLLVAVLTERDRLDGERFHLRNLTGLEALDQLVQLVAWNASRPGLIQAFTVLMGESTADDHPARDWFHERYPRRRANLAAALRAGIDNGEIHTDIDPETVAAQVLAMMDGLQVQWVLDPEQIDMPAIFADYVEQLRQTLRP